MEQSNHTPRIVIVGGGAGGLELATRLGRKIGRSGRAKIALIDANSTHLWKPRLHEVAAGVLNAYSDELNYAAHAKQQHFRYILGKMTGLNRGEKTIKLAAHLIDDQEVLPAREIHYDYLVIAVGSQTNDFNTPGAREHCIFLDKREAAERFQRAFLNIYLRASNEFSDKTPMKPPTQELTYDSADSFNVAIVGAGATGVELAAELAHAAKQLYHYGFDGIKPENVTITLIEAAPQVMPNLSEKSSAAIARLLKAKNIQILTDEIVTEVRDDALITKSGRRIPAQLKVWSAGVKAPEMLTTLDGLETNSINQLLVKDTLQTTNDASIFALGDCTSCLDKSSEQPLPPRAQVASQQALLLTRSLSSTILTGETPMPFIFTDKGSLISLSRKSSVGQLMGNFSKGFTIEGKIARLFYLTLYRLHQIALHGYIKTSLLMLRDRLNRRTGPTIKLH